MGAERRSSDGKCKANHYAKEIVILRTTKVAKAGGPEDEELSMSAQHHLASGDQSHRDLDARERVLNSAIIAADISRGWEEYLEILDAFYAEDVELTTGAETGAVRGRERIRTLLFNFLAPLHVMVEIGGSLYKFERAQFTETPQMRRIRPGQWT
jgi:hypothetical protein